MAIQDSAPAQVVVLANPEGSARPRASPRCRRARTRRSRRRGGSGRGRPQSWGRTARRRSPPDAAEDGTCAERADEDPGAEPRQAERPCVLGDQRRSAVKSRASTKMIDVTRTRSRRIRRGYAREPGVPATVFVGIRSSGASLAASVFQENAPSRLRPRPTFRLTTAEATTTRRAINLRHSVLGASRTLGNGSSPVKHPPVKFGANCGQRVRRRGSDVRDGRERVRAHKKCTEPVAPSSGFPTDLRRSGCRSESHQPHALRTRCISDSRWARQRRQGVLERTFANCALFFSHGVKLRLTSHALGSSETKGLRAEARRRRVVGSPEAPRSGGAGFAGAGAGKEVRRAGNAFVHLPDEPSASA